MWRVKNGAKSVPFKTIKTLPDGSELVMLHESDGMRARRRRETGNPRAPRLPDTAARLVSFTITARTASNAASLSQAAGCQPVLVSFGLQPGWCPVRMAELL